MKKTRRRLDFQKTWWLDFECYYRPFFSIDGFVHVPLLAQARLGRAYYVVVSPVMSAWIRP